MPEILFAHTPPPGSDEWHDLRGHLTGVSNLAATFGEDLSARDICKMLGLCHDLAKADPRFQRYLQDSNNGKPGTKCSHAAPSGAAVSTELQAAVLPILGHHRGLYDAGDAKAALADADRDSITWARMLFEELKGSSTPVKLPEFTNPLAAEMFIRMVFSALVDADYLDTEAHFNLAVHEFRGAQVSMGELATQLNRHMQGFAASSGLVNKIRSEVLASCRLSALKQPGSFRLCVPTGGGKTLSSLTFAIDHALEHRLKRVIVVIPYTSIIDQTAEIYKAVFDPGVVLEHHSSLDIGEDQGESEQRRKLATENWDAPIIVTTTVQFLESLLSSKPSSCRKLHNIAKSVIVLDEVQTLPPHLLEPILDVLGQLISRYGCSVVFCTATQPDFRGLKPKLSPECFRLIGGSIDIIENPARMFDALRRVEYRFLPQAMSVDEVAQRIGSERQVLCVLNTRKDAVKVLNACTRDENLFHLSTLMCPHHRKQVLAEVRRRLRDNLPVRVVSTQVVEAGVDVDFPIVMRDLGPLDRIIQVAGRCNREGILGRLGQCLIFELDGGSKPKGSYLTATSHTRSLLSEHPDRFDSPEVIAKYFERYYGDTQTDSLKIQESRRGLDFETVGRRFKLIDSETVPVFAENYRPGDDPEELDRLLRSYGREEARRWFRRVQAFTVSVYRHQVDELRKEGNLQEHSSGLLIFEGPYSNLLGLGGNRQRDPSDFIV